MQKSKISLSLSLSLLPARHPVYLKTRNPRMAIYPVYPVYPAYPGPPYDRYSV